MEQDTDIVTEDEAEALSRATVRLFEVWSVTDPEACLLLGGMAPDEWDRWKAGQAGEIAIPLRMRMAHLIGIHAGVRRLFHDPERGYAWMRKPNTALDGKSALDVLLEGDLEDFRKLRAWVDAEVAA